MSARDWKPRGWEFDTPATGTLVDVPLDADIYREPEGMGENLGHGSNMPAGRPLSGPSLSNDRRKSILQQIDVGALRILQF